MHLSLPILKHPRSDRPSRAVGGVFTPRPPRAPEHAHADGALLDSHSRTIRDLRLSITDRCNFRCIYCLEPGVRFMPEDELLSVEEFERVARVCIGLGIRKVRITGGEPTVHPRLEEIIARISALDPDVDVAMITNGSLVSAESLDAWRRAGLKRLTISIDGAEPARFAQMTRAPGAFARVMGAIEEAAASGLGPIKLNAVIVRGWNEDQVLPLSQLARRFGVEMRFIEFMPLDDSGAWSIEQVVPADEVLAIVRSAHPLVELGRDDPSSTALRFGFADGAPGAIGVIAPVTNPFCGACSRLRITSDGKVRPCLFSAVEWDLRPELRGGSDDGAIRAFLIDAAWTKVAGHGISTDRFEPASRSMSFIGG